MAYTVFLDSELQDKTRQSTVLGRKDRDKRVTSAYYRSSGGMKIKRTASLPLYLQNYYAKQGV